MSSNPDWVELVLHSTSVLCYTWTKSLMIKKHFFYHFCFASSIVIYHRTRIWLKDTKKILSWIHSYSQISANNGLSDDQIPADIWLVRSNILLRFAYVHVSVIMSCIWLGPQYHLTLKALLLRESTCMYANVASHVTCQQNTVENCPSPQFSIRFVLSIILMIV